jgi:hypothetical protein
MAAARRRANDQPLLALAKDDAGQRPVARRQRHLPLHRAGQTADPDKAAAGRSVDSLARGRQRQAVERRQPQLARVGREGRPVDVDSPDAAGGHSGQRRAAFRPRQKQIVAAANKGRPDQE